MRTLVNGMVAFAFGIVALVSSLLIAFALLSLVSHGTTPGPIAAGVGTIFVAFMFWPVHLFVALIAMSAIFLWRQSRDTRRADEALAKALRDSK